MTLGDMIKLFNNLNEYPCVGYQLHGYMSNLIEAFGSGKKVAEALDAFNQAEAPDHEGWRGRG